MPNLWRITPKSLNIPNDTELLKMILSMLINNINIEVVEFENLKEFFKTQQQAGFVLKLELDEKEAIYYTYSSSANVEQVIFCHDINFNSDYIKSRDGNFVPWHEQGVNCIALAKVSNDTLMRAVLDEYYGINEEEEEKPKKEKKKK